MGRRIIAALVGAACLLGTSAPYSYVLASCNPHRVNNGTAYRIGFYQAVPSGYLGGIYASILNYGPYVFSGSVRSHAQLDNYSETRIAKIGWRELNDGSRYTYTQYHNSSGQLISNSFGAYPEGTYDYYTVLFDQASNQITLRVNNLTYIEATASFTPTTGDVHGAISTLASQMPGGSGNKEWYNDSHIWKSSTGSWVNFSGTGYEVGPSASTYFARGGTSPNYWIYDKACAS